MKDTLWFIFSGSQYLGKVALPANSTRAMALRWFATERGLWESELRELTAHRAA